jgi:exonuclease III
MNCCLWNARSLKDKKDETFNFFNQNNIDIAFISETGLKPDITICHDKYTIHRFDRIGKRMGGVAIIIKKDIEHKVIPSQNLKIIESIGITVKLNNDQLDIFSIYYPGSTKKNKLREIQRRLKSAD